MLNVAALKPSDIERLKSEGLTLIDKLEILASLQVMFRDVRPDGGADSDRIYMAAQMLSMAGVWEKIASAELAVVFRHASKEATAAFLEGLPHDYAMELALNVIIEPEHVGIFGVSIDTGIPVQDRRLAGFGSFKVGRLKSDSTTWSLLEHQGRAPDEYDVISRPDGSITLIPRDPTRSRGVPRAELSMSHIFAGTELNK
jgi:hypothetical protein